MDYRTLEITLQYATDLNKVNFISKMDVYVVVSISGGDKNSKQKTKTTADHDGSTNPTWRFPMKFMVEEAALLQNRLILDFKLKCERALGDREIGEVHVPIKDLLDSPAKGGSEAMKFVSYQVKKPSGKPKGQLTFSYRFPEKTTTSAASPPVEQMCGESVTAYPVLELSSPHPPMAAGIYPPPLPSYPVRVSPEGFEGQYLSSVGHPPASGTSPNWYPTPASGTSPNWYPTPPWCEYPPPPQPGYVYPPPLMQLAPTWWIVDRRYDHFRLS